MKSMDSVRFQKLTDIPVPFDGYSLIAKSVANDGSLLFLSIEPAGVDAVTEKYESGGIFPRTRMRESKRFRLSIWRMGGSLETIDLPELDVTFPLVDIFPDGKILVVGSRCEWRDHEDYDLNGVVFDPKTAKVSRILLGDGINSAYVDALGRIWVAYYDEGILGNFGWGNPGPPPIGSPGLVCFSELGEKVWEYPEAYAIADCYASNVSGTEAAIFFYTDFPICRISSDFKLESWATNLRGCHQFAITETAALFAGRYRDPPDVAYLGRFETGRFVDTRQVGLLLPDGSSLPKGQLLGRGKHLYFFDAASAYRASLSEPALHRFWRGAVHELREDFSS
jgi:hypothetical protein